MQQIWHQQMDILIFQIGNIKLKYSVNAIDFASKCGNIDVLNWFKNNKLNLKYSTNAIDMASRYGFQIGNKLKIKYTHNAIDMASKNGHIDVLNWFKNNNLDLKCTTYAMRMASCNGDIEVLDFLKNSNIKIKNIQDNVSNISVFDYNVLYPSIINTSRL